MIAFFVILTISCEGPSSASGTNGSPEPGMQEQGDVPDPCPAIPEDWSLPSVDRWEAIRYAHARDRTGGYEQRRADLDGDELLDRALFLCRNDSVHPDSAYAVLVQWGDGGDTLLGVFSWAEAMGTIGMGLMIEPPGPLHHLGAEGSPDPPSPLYLDHPALTLVVFEKSAVTWAWTYETCHRVWTGD